MAVKSDYFQTYVRGMPPGFAAKLKAKLACKKALESDHSLTIPSRIWLAFLTPADPRVEHHITPKFKRVWELKCAVLDAFSHPKLFLDTRDPLHRSSDQVTLALLEIIFDLKKEQKVLLPRKRYEEWTEVADHFGLWKLRYALEDALFETFDPENFALFESVVKKQMSIDTRLVQHVRVILDAALVEAGLTGFAIENRRKNISGIYKKVALKHKSINEIFDIHGFRVLTKSKADCYRAIHVLHHLWPHFPERYKDYIEHPKGNGYQSIHTVLSCLERKPVEFQVRTYDMDEIAESGPANHAEYKKATKAT